MKISISKKLLKTHTIVPCYENEVNSKFLFEKTGFKNIKEFKGELNEVYCLLHAENGKKIILLGLGKKDKKENIIQCIRKAVAQNQKLEGILQIDTANIEDNYLEQIIYGAQLASYNLNKFKEVKNVNQVEEIRIFSNNPQANEIAEKTISKALTTINVMDLVNMPSNIKTPYFIADYAVKSGKENGFSVKVIKDKDLEKNNLHAVYAVGKGSANPPAFIIMEYKPKKMDASAKKVGLVGKGISFDTGGISIKPSANMHYMKCDMAGAAAVIGMMEVAAKHNYPHHIIGIVPTAENSVAGNSYRPGDIIKSYSGKNIEVIDTDAEGRLVLADGLSYMVKNFAPDIMIDLATLTGSCVATLGYFAAGMFTNNDDLGRQLYLSGLESGDRVWRLPLWDDYKPYMNSDMADIKNLSSTPVAGATTAAKFLELFTENHSQWIHLDIAGVSFTDNEIFKSRTASGYGIRLLSDFISKL